jgi:hypothetical protein
MTETSDAATAAIPPHKCTRTPDEEWCVKFYWNPATQRYDQPPAGERIRCRDCQYYFDP